MQKAKIISNKNMICSHKLKEYKYSFKNVLNYYHSIVTLQHKYFLQYDYLMTSCNTKKFTDA